MSNAFDYTDEAYRAVTSPPAAPPTQQQAYLDALNKARPPIPGVDEDALGKAVSGEMAAYDKAQARLTDLSQERRKLMAKPIATPGAPNLQNIQQPPKFEYQDSLDAFKSPAVIIAALGSLFTRQPMTAALNAGASAMKSFHEGDQEMMQLHMDQWKAATDMALKQNDIELKRYDAAWKEHGASVEERMAKMQAIAAEVGDNAMQAAFTSKKVDMIDKVLEPRRRAQETGAKAVLDYEKAFDLANIRMGLTVDQQHTMEARAQAIANLQLPPIANPRQPLDRATMARVMEIKPDYDATQYNAKNTGATAEARTGGTQAANLDIIMRNAEAAIPQAIEASTRVPRSSWVPLNKLFQMAESSISDPNLKLFKLANLQLAELWARAMNPRGVMRESDRELALSMLSTADSPETYKKVAESLKTFLQRERQAVKEFREHREPGENSGAPAPQGTAPAGPKVGYTEGGYRFKGGDPNDKASWERVQ